MDNNNWRPSLPNGEPTMDAGDWRTQLPPDSRQKIINKIMETLKKHIPFSGPDGINELTRIAARFEEKIFSSAINQTDYLRKISMKMLTMETKSQNAVGASSTIPAANNGTSMDSTPINQGHLLTGSLPTNQSQASQPLLSQPMQNNTASGIIGSTALPSSMPPVSSVTNNNVTSAVNQSSNMQNVAGMLQDSSGQHSLSSNMFPGSQRQILGRQHAMPSQQQQQPQSAQYLYQQQLQQQLLKQNFQPGNVSNPNSLLPPPMQQQQQNVLQPNQLHSSQQPGVPTSATQPSTVNSASLQQGSPQLSAQQTTQSMLRQHQSSLLRAHPQSQQTSGIHQQQTSLPQQSISPLQQQQTQMMRQQVANSSGLQQKQMMGQNVVGDMQLQHQQRLLNQQNNMMNIQQQQSQQQKQQPPAQQQLMSQQNSLQATHQQSLGTQSNVSGLQQPQQQMLNSQVGNSTLQNSQVHKLSQPAVGVHRTPQAGHGVFSSQGQQSQNQAPQQQMMPQLQSHHHQPGLQQPNLLQQDMQQRLQASGQVTGSLLPPHNVVDQQRQLYQSQRTLPEMPSSSLDSTAQTESANGGDWQEEVFQKIKSMKETYLPNLTEMYQRVGAKLQQLESLPQQQRSEQFEKLKQYKTMLERMMQFLSVSKSNIMPPLKDKVAFYEKQIVTFLKMHGPRTGVQQGQLPQSQMQPMQQTQSQTVQDQSHDNQTNPAANNGTSLDSKWKH